MNGAPAKPISGTSPSARHQQRHRIGNRRNLLRVKGFHRRRRRRRCAPGARSPARRRARCPGRCPTPRSGTTMSENRIAASTPCRRTGCSVISADQLGVEAGLPSCVFLARSARYSGSERPACRMNHTGTRLGLRPRGGGQIRRLGQLAAGIHRLQCCHAAMTASTLGVRLRRIRRACAQTWPDGLASMA